jgi:FkbM family methyltransferase
LFKEYGWWFPDGEIHLPKMCMEHRPSGMEKTRGRRRALDIGAHIGLWSLDMARDFEVVEAFEPVERHRECFVRNVLASNINLYPFACGDKPDRVSLGMPEEGHTGHTVVVPGDDVEVVVLDDYNFKDVDFIKVDCEGYELFVLKGAEKTIVENRPTIIVEQKPGNALRYNIGETDAVPYLTGLGMKLMAEIQGDFILSWKAYH